MTAGFDPYQPNIWVTPNSERASVDIQGVLVPTGTFAVERSVDGGNSWTPIRSGTGTITTGQFHVEDTEPPLGVDLLYRITIDQDTPDVIERNSVTTPRVNRGVGSWVIAAPRTYTIVDNLVGGIPEKVLQITGDPAGASVWTVARTNLALNPQDRTGGAAGWLTTRGFGTGGAGTYTHSQTVPGLNERFNQATNPTPASATGWVSNDAAKWTVSYAANEISIGRQASATVNVAASLSTIGGIANPTLGVGIKYQRAVEVWVDQAATLTNVSPGGFVGGQALPANTWTRVVEQFDGSGSAQYVMALGVTITGATTGTHVKLRKAQLIANPAGTTVTYFDGATAATGGWTFGWTGTANASTSIATDTFTTAIRKTWSTAPSTAANAGFQIQNDATNYFPVTAGKTVSVSAYMRHNSTTAKTLVSRIQFYDRVAVSGAVAVGTTTAGTSTVAPGNSTGWVRVGQSIVVPAGALGMAVYMDTANVGDTPWAAGNTMDCTALLVEVADAPTAYFDGALFDTSTALYDWTGTAWNSTSTASALHLAGRNKIATVGLGGTLAAGTYHVSGRIKYYDANLMRWLELRDGPPPRTWRDVRTIGSWGTVRGSASSNADIPYGEVRISIVNGSGTTVAGPIVAISPSVDKSQQWIEFNLDIDLTASLTGGRLVVAHGTNTREYTATWWLTRFILLPKAQADEPYLHFFDGDWPVPADAEDYEWENGVFDSDQEGTIRWEGTAGNSTSVFTTPDVVYTIAAARVDPPASAPVCDPVHLNLPIQPSMGQWFGLIKVSTLSHPGRASALEVIRRRPSIVVSDVRGWERGELTLLTRTLAERRMAVGIFGTGQIVQFRNPNLEYPEGSEGGPWYLGVTDLNEERPFKDHRRPERYWIITFVRVEKPVGLIAATAGVGSSWQHTKDTPAGATWRIVRDTHANWADVIYRDVAPTDPSQPLPGAGMGLPTHSADAGWKDLPAAEPAWAPELLPT